MNRIQTPLTVTFPPSDASRLRSAAYAFGTTPDALVRHIAAKTSQDILAIPEESLDEYDYPEEILQDFKQALKDQRHGRIMRKLPLRLRSR